MFDSPGRELARQEMSLVFLEIQESGALDFITQDKMRMSCFMLSFSFCEYWKPNNLAHG